VFSSSLSPTVTKRKLSVSLCVFRAPLRHHIIIGGKNAMFASTCSTFSALERVRYVRDVHGFESPIRALQYYNDYKYPFDKYALLTRNLLFQEYLYLTQDNETVLGHHFSSWIDNYFDSIIALDKQRRLKDLSLVCALCQCASLPVCRIS
jgi:hypothetical protein